VAERNEKITQESYIELDPEVAAAFERSKNVSGKSRSYR
jgi:hypothetical protein